MPVSYHEPYEAYKEWLTLNKPKTLFDIGMGYGNIGLMAKNILKDIELNGVEVFLPYLVHQHSNAVHYKRIIISNVMDLTDKLWPVDLVTAFDVIEHLPRNDGIGAINYLKSISNMGLLVSVPIVDYPQGAVYGNEAEEHKTQWKVEEMKELGGKVLFEGKVCGLFEFKR